MERKIEYSRKAYAPRPTIPVVSATNRKLLSVPPPAWVVSQLGPPIIPFLYCAYLKLLKPTPRIGFSINNASPSFAAVILALTDVVLKKFVPSVLYVLAYLNSNIGLAEDKIKTLIMHNATKDMAIFILLSRIKNVITDTTNATKALLEYVSKRATNVNIW